MRRWGLPARRDEGIWRSIDRIHEELDRWFSDIVDTFFGDLATPIATSWGVSVRAPSIDLYDQGSELVLKAELPGIDPKDVDIRVLEDRVMIRGEIRRDEEVKEKNYYRCERAYGSFARTIPLPMKVKPSEAKASYKNGILTLTLPKAEPEKEEGVKIDIRYEE